MIKQKSHIVIDAYMLQLGLKGNELLIYALIAGFCQDGVSECWTSQETMAEWCGGISTRAVRDILQNLITKKLITKKECLNKNVKYSYKVVEIVPELSSNEQELSSNEQEVFSTQQEVFSGGDRNFLPVVQELSSGNNKIDNIYDNKIDNKTIKENIILTNNIKENFDEFWSLYPKDRIGNKAKAYSAFCKVIKEKRATIDKLLASVKNYARSEEVHKGFAKGCAAWLNDDRFNQDYKEYNEFKAEFGFSVEEPW